MENEATINNTDLTPLIEEIQILNKNTISNGKRLDQITEYLIAQDKLQAKKEEEQKVADQEASELKEAEQQEAEQQEAEQQEQQNETYTELLQNVSDQLEIQNALIAGQNFMSGIICGVLLFTILWNKIGL